VSIAARLATSELQSSPFESTDRVAKSFSPPGETYFVKDPRDGNDKARASYD
jgi:hypothetical protein